MHTTYTRNNAKSYFYVKHIFPPLITSPKNSKLNSTKTSSSIYQSPFLSFFPSFPNFFFTILPFLLKKKIVSEKVSKKKLCQAPTTLFCDCELPKRCKNSQSRFKSILRLYSPTRAELANVVFWAFGRVVQMTSQIEAKGRYCFCFLIFWPRFICEALWSKSFFHQKKIWRLLWQARDEYSENSYALGAFSEALI